MYGIWTTLYGISVPNELTSRLQETEISEFFYELENLPKGFECSIPYSGDLNADLHLGVVLFSTEELLGNRNAKERKVTTKTKQIVEDGVTILKSFLKTVKERSEGYGNTWTKEDQDVIDELIKCLDNKPEIYKAYSTS